MYAIVQIGGNQYKVQKGETLLVDRMSIPVDQLLTFPAIMVADEKQVKLGKEASSVIVTTKVIEHFKGDKIDIRRFRHKVRHRRHVGFRPSLTKLQVESIGSDKVKQEKTVKPKTVTPVKRAVKTSKK